MVDKVLKAMSKNVVLDKVQAMNVQMGSDPEFFFKKNDKVIGSEHLIAEKGEFYLGKEYKPYGSQVNPKFVRDGVQVELNPQYYTCRGSMGNEFRTAFQYLQKLIKSKDDKVKVCFSRSVRILKSELMKLDPKNQVFGCMPSKNAYGEDNSMYLASVDATKYRIRSAGGHIHISPSGDPALEKVIKNSPDKLVQLLDIIVGNTCVMIDREPGNKIRRKLYGRAGEYRTPKHGVEYRVLSNFWLEACQLMSLSMALVRLTCNIISSGEKNVQAFFDAVDPDNIREAINKNDLKLARKNWEAIKPLIEQATADYGEFYGICKNTMPEFEYFLKMIEEKGLSHWLDTSDPVKHWTGLTDAHHYGFNLFLLQNVRPAMVKLKLPVGTNTY